MNANVKLPAAKGVFIDNKWQPAQSGRTIAMLAPATGQVIASIAAGDKADIDLAVAAARRALEGPWGCLAAVERGRLLSKLGRLVEDNAEELAKLEAADTGKPMKQARADVVAVARYFEYYGGAADKVHGDTIPFLDGFFVTTVYEPLGVTAHIIPWNYPGQMFGRTVAPALAMGNATVIKPAEEACLVPLRLAELAAEAGFPAGAINVVPGLGEEAGAALSAHDGIDFLSFTGSPEVGTLVQTAAAKNHIGCTLELGGKSPQIVFADADLDAALTSVAAAIVQNAGQTCSAGSRVLVERTMWDRFLSELKLRFEKITAGTPEMDLDLGPVISAVQKKRIEGMLARAESGGATRVATGKIAEGVPSEGFYVAPALYHHVDRNSELAREEVFGPVLAAMPFDDEADAIRLANGTDFGLVAGVWSGDGSRAMRVARKVKVGQMFVNGYGAGGGIELPFGGMKKSGHGRGKGFEALYEFGAMKTLIVKHG
ncbi:NAD-dependent aldehyde dehydrogenase [Bradyrhizobium sp. ORS 285]|uniref:aldehyde dehydrogenase family protein n=1 Tax=Bradyrhizobium sp. ORS 285 TaxID=115808 RepID=UPI0002407977|nr:aldehyde dehydrogenase family protein [Bradyrhizobium sp. ORS 285]CCD89644.1 NAD-dependent aldehyde dehydrogenase [Bradyrhizobium sp. ORS 285]SMX56323.1 NAD-dependent aldehyde dehydrogenase [Bradyrhizobium sp. ORS 285]